MQNDSLDMRIDDTREKIAFTFAGETIAAYRGDSVAAALIASGIRRFRTTPGRGAARGPFCLIGLCFDCLVEIDGVPNQQACMVQAENGIKVQPMHGARQLPETAHSLHKDTEDDG